MLAHELRNPLAPIKTAARMIAQDSNSTSASVLVALTGYGQLQDKELARKAGFDFHLTKPADFRELDAILERVIERKAQVEQ